MTAEERGKFLLELLHGVPPSDLAAILPRIDKIRCDEVFGILNLIPACLAGVLSNSSQFALTNWLSTAEPALVKNVWPRLDPIKRAAAVLQLADLDFDKLQENLK